MTLLSYLHLRLAWDIGPSLALSIIQSAKQYRPGYGRELRVLIQATCLLEEFVDSCPRMF